MKYFYLSFLSFFFLSCSSTDEGSSASNHSEADSELKFIPTKLTSSEQISLFFYDDQDRLIEYQENSTENLYSKKYTITYKNNYVERVLLEYESEDLYNYTSEYTFEYSTEKVTVTNHFIDINDYSTTNSKSLKIDITNFVKSGYGITATYDLRKNLTEIIQNNSKTNHSFDNSNAIFKNVNTPQWLLYYVLRLGFHKTNNPVKIENSELNSDESNSSVFSYEYNSDNYPTKQFVTDNNSQTIETHITYIIK